MRGYGIMLTSQHFSGIKPNISPWQIPLRGSATGRVLNSAAIPLPTALYRPKIPLPEARLNCTQVTDSLRIFMIRGGILRIRKSVFPLPSAENERG
jgi:hypothetical protein